MSRQGRLALGAVAAIALLAIVETVVALVAPSRAPTDGDWQAAATAVRQGFRPGDLIVAAPAWADPILRVHLGDLIPPAVAARMDDARFARVWEIGQRGARSPEGTRGQVTGDWTFGRLRVRLVERPAPAVTYDFLAHASEARASAQGPGGARPVGLQSQIAEVDQRLRRAIVTQPVAGATVVVEFPAVPLGRQLAVATGLHDTWMRKAASGTVERSTPVVTYDFLAHASEARASAQGPGGARPVGLQSQIAEVDQRLRRAIVTQPVAGATVVVEFPAVQLGRQLAIATGLHDTWMRKAASGTVEGRLSIGDRTVVLPPTTNDSGWTETLVDTAAEDGRTLPVRLQITSAAPLDRLFAFAAEARR